MKACFHCSEPIAAGSSFLVAFGDRREPVCCAGCAAAAAAIRDAGLADYYRYRSAPASRVKAAPLDRYRHYDSAMVQDRWTHSLGEGRRQAQLLLEGVSCAACTWLVEKRLGQIDGVLAASANPATARVAIGFDPARTSLGRLLATIDALGFRPHVVGEVDTRSLAARESRALLRRLAVAGLGMMQVMMFALALYAGAFDGMDEVTRRFFQLVSLLLTVPVAFYAGSPFLRGALRSLRAGEIGMDVTVSLAILIAFFGSAWQALRGADEVWFDSVVMFVFLLLLARYAEMQVRHGASTTSEALLRLLPAAARRRTAGRLEPVPAEALLPDDVILVPGGETFPADGLILGPATHADESMITGESIPVAKPAGAVVLAGSLNAGDATECRVTAVGEATTLSGLVRLIDRAQAAKPAMASRADRLATRFLGALLMLALLVGLYWAGQDPSRLVPAVIAVLVVACPCALSLAVPTVLAAAHRHLARRGVLVVNPDALERLAGITDLVFDKTGTLTRGQPAVAERVLLDTDLQEADVLQLAAALEAAANHPLARAFPALGPLPRVTETVGIAGEGLEGYFDGRRWRIGRASFVAGLAGDMPPAAARHNVFLGGEGRWLAAFTVRDELRPEAVGLLRRLRSAGLRLHLASGDHEPAVAAVARELAIDSWRAAATPDDKVAWLQQLQRAGARVAMVGDGLNDAPVLAAADVSFALREGTALARAQADIVLAGGGLAGLATALEVAQRGMRLMRQNLRWSAAYNLLAVPAAAVGWVAPWLAAIGMSASSLGVVLNSLRVARPPPLAEVRHGKPPVDRPAQPGPGGAGPLGVLLGRRRRTV